MKYSETPPSERRWSIADVRLEPIHGYPGTKAGWVYFIVCKDTERCKIGYTKSDPYKRLHNLQTGSASKLRLLAAQPGTVETERALHARFAEHGVHGEWFEMHDELFAYICATIVVMASFQAGCKQPLDEWMKVGLRMLNDGMAEVPEELMALT